MNQPEIIQKIASALMLSPEELNEQSRAADFEEWDSMGTMAIMTMLDGDYGVRLSPGDAAQLQSVPGILELLKKEGKL